MSDLESLLEYNEIVKKLFATEEEEGFQFYNNYGLRKFSVRRSYCEWDNGHNEMTLRKFVCSRQGFREEKQLKRAIKKRKPRNITRVGCLAKFVIARDQTTGQWYVKDFIDEHNHPMAPAELTCLLRSHRRISDEQKAEIAEMESSGIRKHKIIDILEMQYGGYDKIECTTRDLYNFCHLAIGGDNCCRGAQTVISYPCCWLLILLAGEGDTDPGPA
ncbi:unnamed protein product [Miscanthus lutarioriparius]|uniref:FAR1 domain-containing protein n=1 Tax=Miscanthus lutarioriparius TaxID=422564 RepID=A0A811PQQ2_9POAL|nr:unnamed protein product [Miscanthus lutarioriparius]